MKRRIELPLCIHNGVAIGVFACVQALEMKVYPRFAAYRALGSWLHWAGIASEKRDQPTEDLAYRRGIRDASHNYVYHAILGDRCVVTSWLSARIDIVSEWMPSSAFT